MKINFKVFLGFLCGSVILIATLSIIFYNDLFNILTNQSLAEKRQEIVLRKEVIEDSLHDLEAETIFISELSSIEEYVNTPSYGQKTEEAEELHEDFKKFMEKHSAYKQIIFLNEYGDQITNTILDENRKDITPEEKTLNQNNTYYFLETKKLKKGQIFVSMIKEPINNEMDMGDVAGDHNFVFNYSTPIFDNFNNFKGILIVTSKAKSIISTEEDYKPYTDFIQTEQQAGDNKIYVVENNGYYLHNEDMSKEWDFIDGGNSTIFKDFPVVGNRILSTSFGQFFDEKIGMFATYYRIKPFSENISEIHMGDHQHTSEEATAYTMPNDSDTYWTIVILTEEGKILNRVNILFYKTLSLLFLILIMFIISMMWFLRIIVIEPLEKLRQGANRIKKGNLDYQLDMGKKKDEIADLAQEFNSMAIVLKQYKTTMETQVEKRTADLEKFKLAVENVFDSVTITDPDGNILYTNNAVERITGFTKREIIGKKIGTKELWGGLMTEEFYENMWNVIKNEKKPFMSEVKNKNKAGEQYNSLLSITPILDKQHNILFFVSIEKDMSNITKAYY